MPRWLISTAAVSFLPLIMCVGCIPAGHGMLPIPLIPVAMLVGEIHRERVVASYGDQAASDRMCFRFPVSDQFGTNDLWGLYETLNSETLQAPLAKYNCGDPVPKFTFRVSLIRYPIRKTDKLAVDWCYVPTLDLRDRGLDDG